MRLSRFANFNCPRSPFSYRHMTKHLVPRLATDFIGMKFARSQIIGVGEWYVLCAIVGLLSFQDNGGISWHQERNLLMAWILVVLGLPTSLTGCLLLAGIGSVGFVSESWIDGVVTWLVLSTSGVIQWFVVLPCVYKRLIRTVKPVKKGKEVSPHH